MRKTLLATVAALSLLVATPSANAQFAVIDPANLVQNVQQVFQAIEEGIRTLRQIELATQTVTGIDLSLTAALTEQLVGVQTVLNNGAALVFQETESLDQFRELFPEGFEALDTLEDVVGTLQLQNSRLLAPASRRCSSNRSAPRPSRKPSPVSRPPLASPKRRSARPRRFSPATSFRGRSSPPWSRSKALSSPLSVSRPWRRPTGPQSGKPPRTRCVGWLTARKMPINGFRGSCPMAGPNETRS